MVPAHRARSGNGDRFAPLRSDEDDLIAVVRFAVGPDIDHELVHADSPHDRAAAPPDDHLAAVGQGMEVAIAVSDRDGHDPGVPDRTPSGAVTDRVSGGLHLEEHDSGLPGKHRAHVDGLGHLVGRVDTEEKDSGPDQVEVGVRVLEDCPRVGEVQLGDRHSAIGVEGDRLQEPLQLLAGLVPVGAIGGSKVAVDPFNLQVGGFKAGPEHGRGGLGSHPDPSHTGVDLEMNPSGHSQRLRSPLDILQLLDR